MVTCRGCGVTVHIDEYEAAWERFVDGFGWDEVEM